MDDDIDIDDDDDNDDDDDDLHDDDISDTYDKLQSKSDYHAKLFQTIQIHPDQWQPKHDLQTKQDVYYQVPTVDKQQSYTGQHQSNPISYLDINKNLIRNYNKKNSQ